MDVSVIFGVLGNIFAALLFLSPLDTFWRIVKNGSTQDFESIPYIVLLLTASIWTYYGIIKPVVLLVTINGFGTLMMTIYVIIFLIFAPRRMKAKTAALALVLNVGFLAAVIVGTRLMMSHQAQVNTIGTLCVCITIISFASPLAALKSVVATKSVEFMDVWLIVFYCLQGSMWTVYSLLAHDTFILIPNAVGLVLGVVQLVLYAWYKKPWQFKRRHGDGALEDGGQQEHLIVVSD